MRTIRFCILFFLFQLLFQQNYSLDFDGSMDLVQIENGSALLANETEISIGGWVYLRNYNAGWPDFDACIGIRNESDADFYILQVNDFKLEGRLRGSSGQVFTVTTAPNIIQPEVWQHVALTYDGTELTLFVNGWSAGSISASAQIEKFCSSI